MFAYECAGQKRINDENCSNSEFELYVLYVQEMGQDFLDIQNVDLRIKAVDIFKGYSNKEG